MKEWLREQLDKLIAKRIVEASENYDIEEIQIAELYD